MVVHLYLIGGNPCYATEHHTTCVSVMEASHTCPGIVREMLKGSTGKALVLGSVPDVTVVPFSQIDWFWIEEEYRVR